MWVTLPIRPIKLCKLMTGEGLFSMNKDDRVLLQGTPIFGGLSEESIDFLLADGALVTRREGELFFREGDAGQSVYVLRSGRVTIGKDWKDSHVILRELRRGDCFGEMALLDLEPRSATVTAYEDSAAFEIPLARLQALNERDIEQYLIIHMNMAREVSRRLRVADMRLFDLAMNSSDEGYDKLFLFV